MGAKFYGIEGDKHSYTPSELANFTQNVAQSIKVGTKIELKQFKVEINLGNIDLELAKDYLTGIVTKKIEYVMTEPKPNNGKFVFVISSPGFATNQEEIRNVIKEFTTTYKIMGKDIKDDDILITELVPGDIEKLYPE